MKKIFGMVACLTLFVGCQKNDITDTNRSNPNVVGFSTNLGRSKATTADLSVLEGSADGFGVFATRNDGGVQKSHIANLPYRYNAGTWTWKDLLADAMPTWPLDAAHYPLNFYAYYPKNITLSETTAPFDAVHVIEPTAAAQKDLLAAHSLNILSRPVSGKVVLAFDHILSKVDFKLVAGNRTKVYVAGVKVVNVGSTGTFNYKSKAWTTSPSTGDYTNNYVFADATNLTDNTVTGSDPTEATAVALACVAGANHALMLMPQTATANKWDKAKANIGIQTMIEVIYRMESGGKDVVAFGDATKHPNYTTLGSSVTGPIYVKVAYPLDAAWTMKKSYTYTICLGTNGASNGNLIEGKFVDEDGNPTDLPVVDSETGDPIEVPNPITDTTKPIDFVVSVVSWDAAGGGVEVK